MKGAANLYTKEFFEAAREHLNPGGVVTMYIQLFETNLDAVKSAVATFFEVFPNGTHLGQPVSGTRPRHGAARSGRAAAHRSRRDGAARLSRPEYSRVAQSLARGRHEFRRGSVCHIRRPRSGSKRVVERCRDQYAIGILRMQYLAGLGLNLDDSAAIYAGMLTYRRFPARYLHRLGRPRRLPPRSDPNSLNSFNSWLIPLAGTHPAFMTRQREQCGRLSLANLSLASSQDNRIVLERRTRLRESPVPAGQHGQVPAGRLKPELASAP